MSRSHLIQHPGSRTSPRRHVVSGAARIFEFDLPEGMTLMAAVAKVMDETGCDSAVVRLDGLSIGPYNYVMPDQSPDGQHVAWYSKTYLGDAARLQQGTAIIGRRDGDWFLHCHAVWQDSECGRCAGHLLPGEVIVASSYFGKGYAFDGGCFDVTPDAETNFSFFRPRIIENSQNITQENAAIVSLAPHEDLSTSVAELSEELGLRNAHVLGIGSLIGADFRDEPSMESPISEVLLLDGARVNSSDEPYLPTFCVDPEGNFFEGQIVSGRAPVCVTFELILVAS
ncbi:hypothetical protein [Roseibium algae]|uniref:DUF296 domain-containing protein n=1 Tax=Roseibium algae TaxID=3123038 RepID=A0ABU8TF16_9HYPH